MARTLGRTNNMVPSAVTCLGMWGLPGWDRENAKCLELITLPTATVFTKGMLKGWKACIKAAASPPYEMSGNQLPCFPAESCGLVLLFSSHNSAAGLVTKKTQHKLPKINRGKAFLSDMRARNLSGWVCAPSLLCSTPMVCVCLDQLPRNGRCSLYRTAVKGTSREVNSDFR